MDFDRTIQGIIIQIATLEAEGWRKSNDDKMEDHPPLLVCDVLALASIAAARRELAVARDHYRAARKDREPPAVARSSQATTIKEDYSRAWTLGEDGTIQGV
jgi:hypothetical protein